LDSLALPLAPGFVVVAGHLQGQLEEQLLHRFENDPRHAVGFRCKVREIHQTRHRKLCALSSDRGDELFGFGEEKSADAVDLLGNHHFAGLQFRNHPQQLGPVRASTRGLLAVDPGDVVTGGSRALFDLALGWLRAFLVLHNDKDESHSIDFTTFNALH